MPQLRLSLRWLFPAALMLAGCASSRVVGVPSANQDGRVRFLVLHFTDENFERSLDLLTRKHDNPVSAHYLVSRAGEYGRKQPTILRLVDESQRAWHAGPSRWQGHEPLNGESIGIEIVYESHCSREARAPGRSPSASEAMVGRARPPGVSPWVDDAICPYPPYPPDQIDAVIALARDIVKRHPEIEPTRIVGHCDIQPENKTDPGPMFPWRQLAAAGIGAWYDDADVMHFRAHFAAHAAPLKLVQQALIAYGYGLEASGTDDLRTREVLSAFQSHFLPDRRSGVADSETVATLFALLAKYRPGELQQLSGHDADIPPPPMKNPGKK